MAQEAKTSVHQVAFDNCEVQSLSSATSHYTYKIALGSDVRNTVAYVIKGN
jgi:hypothetical protein